MNTYLDCYPCFLRHALEATRAVNQDEGVQKVVLTEVMETLKKSDLRTPPPRLAQLIHKRIRKVTGIRDPYRAIKAEQNKYMLGLETILTEHVKSSSASLEQALKLAGACNAIDMGPTRNWNRMEELFDRLLNPSVGRFDLDALENQLPRSKRMLYIGDNAGEIVGDKILLSVLKKYGQMDISFAVRGGPILNDATLEDAAMVGIKKWAHVITTGADCPGVILGDCSREFREAFENADIILAKGQGNYESLEREKRIFFLLQVKCHIVARDLGADLEKITLCTKTVK